MKKIRITRALCAIALTGAALWCSPLLAEDVPPYLIARSNDSLSFQAGNELELRVATRSYGIPGTPSFLSSDTVWTPIPALAVRAGVTQATSAPCPAPLGEDCEWSFIDAPPEDTGFNVGASWRPIDSLSVSVDYRNEPVNLRGGVANQPEALGQFAASEDLSLSCRLDTDSFGDLELGLQLSRWQESAMHESPISTNDPYTSAALGVGWQIGSFRGDLTGRYMQMLDGNNGDAWNTLDVSIAWKTPWNASLSVGARNVFNQPAPVTTAVDEPVNDDFLGRVPYVRYQQDL